jgi:hypothetical protein
MYDRNQVREALDTLLEITGRPDLVFGVRQYIAVLHGENHSLKRDKLELEALHPEHCRIAKLREVKAMQLSPIVIRANIARTTEGTMRNRRFWKRRRREKYLDFCQKWAVEIISFLGLLGIGLIYWAVAMWLLSPYQP